MNTPVLATPHDAAQSHRRAPMRSRLGAFSAAGLLALGGTLGVGLAMGAAAPALAHDQITSYDVEHNPKDETITGLTLSFNNKIVEVGSEIHITDAGNTDLASGDPVVNGTEVTQSVAAPLVDGHYTVQWRVVSSDGHPITGVLAFEVINDTTVKWLAAGDVPEGEVTTQGETSGTDEGAEHEHEQGETAHATEGSASQGNGGPGATTVIIVAAIAVVAVGATVVLTKTKAKKSQLAAADSAATAPSENDVKPSAVADGAEKDSTL